MTDTLQRPDGWDDILDQGERILWQGRPDSSIIFKLSNIPTLIFGLFFAGFAVFWMAMASSAGGYFWMFGLIHFSVGIGVAFGSVLGPPWKRRHMWYTLTDRRAIIATNLPIKGKQLKSYPINADTVLDFTNGPLATIHFSHEMRRVKNGTRRKNIGFERITDGHTVYKMMRDVQQKDHDRQAGNNE